MSVSDRLKAAVQALLGVSAYQPPGTGFGPHITDKQVEETREALGGNIQPLPVTRLRWYLANLEEAQAQADSGYIRMAAQLWRAMRRDGTLQGLLSTRTAGLVRLPKRFYGNADVATILKARNGTRSVFDEMFPPSELALMVGDGIGLGVSVAELVPVEGRSYPVMVRLEPEFLQYRWTENRWYFLSVAGAIPIVPGDGRWILHVPGGRLTPWTSGLWPALGRSFINKEHAMLHRSNYSAKLANPARLAYAPAGGTEAQRLGFFQRLLRWNTNTVLELPPGYDAKILETNGRGFDVFQKEIDTSDKEYLYALSGQTMTGDGGAGFSNGEVGEQVKADLIQENAEQLAYTINTQGLPQFLVSHWGEEALQSPAIVEWDTGRPQDKDRESRMLGQVATAISAANAALAPYELRVDVNEVAVRFGIPVEAGAVEMPSSDEDNAAPQSEPQSEKSEKPQKKESAEEGDGGGGKGSSDEEDDKEDS